MPINQNQFDEELMFGEQPFGPIELNILERVERGFTNLEIEREDEQKPPLTPPSEKGKYVGDREVIFVSGWVNVDAVYERFFWGFVSKIFIGILVLSSLQYNNQNFWPVAGGLAMVNLLHLLKTAFFLLRHKCSHQNIKIGLWLDFNLSLGYLTYFVGFLLVFMNLITNRFLPMFALPFLAFSAMILFSKDESNYIISQKKFQIFEGIQLFLIAMKFSETGFVNWNYTLIFYMAASIYLTVLGFLLTIILSCSLFGFLYQDLEAWKLKSLIWMTSYYVSSGAIYIYFIKGIIQFYHEDNTYEPVYIANYSTYTSADYHVLQISAIFLIVFSLINMVFHLAWKGHIKNYLSKIIYKNELKKEINLKFFSKSFTFRLIQVSATYFTRVDQSSTALEPSKSDGNSKDETAHDSVTVDLERPAQPSGLEQEFCIFCCETKPDIMMDPCCHGGVCKKCIVEYLKGDENKCPFCKGKIDKLYLIEFEKERASFMAKGEITFNRFM
jgi:hypothetical protein